MHRLAQWLNLLLAGLLSPAVAAMIGAKFAATTVAMIAAMTGPLIAQRTACGDEPSAASKTRLTNGILEIGVSAERGGSIGYLADVKLGGNMVNTHDLGRWIGQSYYAGPKPFGRPHPGWPDWPWNPVSAGDVYGHPSRLLETTNDGKTLYVKSIPQQWALDDVPGDCQFETWITLDERTVHVRNRLTGARHDRAQYPAMDQELPALYTIGTLHRLVSYVGDTPWADRPPQAIPLLPLKGHQPQWSRFFATEHWAALLDDNNWGLGIIHPGVVRFLGGFYGQPNIGGSADNSTGYIAPVRQEMLDHDIVYTYEYTLVLDTLANIRKAAYALRPRSALPDYRFTHDRQHWWLAGATDSGWPLPGRWHVNVDSGDPQMFGPETFFSAADVPKLYVRAAYRTTSRTAEIFWETTEAPGFSPDRKVTFAIEPDGKFRTYEVRLADHPAYRGAIRRLRFDPVQSGAAGEFVDVEFMAASKD